MACIIDLQLRHNLASELSYSYATHSDISQKGPSIKYLTSIKYVTLFWTNFDSPPSVTLCHTSRTPQFLVVHAYIGYMSLQGVCVSSRGFLFGGLSGGFLSGRFGGGWFLSVHPSVRINTLQQKTKHHFQF